MELCRNPCSGSIQLVLVCKKEKLVITLNWISLLQWNPDLWTKVEELEREAIIYYLLFIIIYGVANKLDDDDDDDEGEQKLVWKISKFEQLRVNLS